MHKYIIKRLLMMIPVLVGVVLIIFSITYIMPGDPAAIRLGEQATSPEALHIMREQMGLNDPFFVRLFSYIADVLRLDFGVSWHNDQPVFAEIAARFPTTMQLAAMGIIMALIIGIPLGILSATKQYSAADVGANFVGLLGVSVPNFWLGMLLILFFAVELRWLPTSGWMTPMHWILPVLTIGTGSASLIMRMTRSSMLECIRSDYIRTARAKGQSESVVIYRHALKNALIPVVTVAGISFGQLLGGAVLTETIFAIPGLGRFIVDAIQRRDFPVVQGGVLLLALSFSIVNLLVDILYAYIDPRIRSQYK